MTPEERDLLTKSIILAEENNKMLKSIRRSARISSVLRVLYWLIILGASFGAYYFIQPYIDVLLKAFDNTKEIFNINGSL